MSTVLTFQHVKIAPYDMVHLLEMTMTKTINEHARLFFRAIVPEAMKDSYVEMTDTDTTIEVSQVDEKTGENAPLFHGLVEDIRVRTVRDIFYLEVEAISHTYQLDLERKSRSFQNKAMSYGALIQTIAADYPGMDVMDHVSGGASLGEFTMQYKETDWAFLRRLASRFQAGLFPATEFGTPKFHFGTPDSEAKGKMEDFHYTIRKRMTDYRTLTNNGAAGMNENDFLTYEVETTKHVLDLGNSVHFKGKPMYVYEARTELKDGMVKHRYLLSPKKGLSQKPLFHRELIGASVQGKVIDVAKDTVKVHLDIDPSQNKSEAHWFPYASVYTAEGNSGWHCMPELGDQVRVYFSGDKEADGIASSSVRMDTEEGESNKLGNPDNKFFRTPNGKEIMFSPDEIVITGKDGETFIKINDGDGIQIISGKKITIVAEEDIIMETEKKVIISGKEEISLTCKESEIKMDGITTIVGNEVRTN